MISDRYFLSKRLKIIRPALVLKENLCIIGREGKLQVCLSMCDL